MKNSHGKRTQLRAKVTCYHSVRQVQDTALKFQPAKQISQFKIRIYYFTKPYKYVPGSMEQDYLNATYGYKDLIYPDADSNLTWNVTVTRDHYP
jgi:hypothetical protein